MQPPVLPPDDAFDVVAVDGLVVVARVVGAAVLEGDVPACCPVPPPPPEHRDPESLVS